MFSAMGTNPRDATRAVISTGRRRVRAPSTIASVNGRPSARSLRMKVTITRPFRTAMPDRAMKPTAAEMENGMPRNARAAMPR